MLFCHFEVEMLSKLLPLLFLFLGTGGGIAAAIFLTVPKPVATSEDSSASPSPDQHSEMEQAISAVKDYEETDVEYVRLNNQFVVPVVDDRKVEALIVLTISLEVASTIGDAVFEHEPKLRDEFLQVLFDHANMGGFSGNFTKFENLSNLKAALLDVAQMELGPGIVGVLIESIGRQDT